MVCTHRADVAERIRTFRGQGADPRRQYWFEVTGYNYRMTNLACAIGLAQLERFRELHQRREQVRAWYEAELCPRSLRLLRQETPADSEPALWMYGVVLEEGTAARRDAIRAAMASEGIETRPFFTALHRLPMFRDCRTDAGCVCSLRLGECGIMLPTHTKLTREDVRDVVDSLARTVQATTRHVPSVPVILSRPRR
jgi:perosamine synthetase